MISLKFGRPAAWLRFASAFALGLVLLQPVGAQHRRDYRGIDARTFNPGRGVYGAAVAGPGMPSSATYSNGRMTMGVVRTPAGAVHFSNGFVVPAAIPNVAIVNGPWLNGYGGGIYTPRFPGGSPYVNAAILPPVIVDPFTGQLVPFDPWCVSGLPYFGGINPYYPGSILAPMILSMNLSMRPSVPSTAAYTFYDPRVLDLIAPAQLMMPGEDLRAPNAVFIPGPAAEPPLLNEFERFPREENSSGLAAKINSLRYQSTGDEAFRKGDYVAAKVAYQSGLLLASDRRSLWIRMAFVQIALEDFDDAVRHLKTGLKTPADATRGWISAEELYGEKVAERTRTHGANLWNWLAVRPLSSDRLLLAGTFQKFRGFEDSAHELLEMASHEGPEAEYVAAAIAIAESDIGQRAVADELGRMVDEVRLNDSVHRAASSESNASERPEVKATAARANGIFLRGKTSRSPDSKDSSDQATQPPELFIPKL